MSWLDIRRLRYYTSIVLIYGLSALFVVYCISPNLSLSRSPIALTRQIQKPFIPTKPNFVELNGFPVRIVLPDSNVDLEVIPGYYDQSVDSWTLSGYDAQFAMISTLPNNLAGQTFIYGHNNDYVFGALRHVTPSAGQKALIYTSNNHVFEYSFENVSSVGPNDVSILKYNGPPSLLIQTCTGSLNEWRTEYSYKFVKVIS